MTALAHYAVARSRSFHGWFHAQPRRWESIVALLLSAPVVALIGFYVTERWLDASRQMVALGGEALLSRASRLAVGGFFLLTVPLLVTATYATAYPEGEIAFLRSLPIGKRQLFAVRLLPCAIRMGLVLMPVFFLVAAACWQAGNRMAPAWLGLGWVLLSVLGATTTFSIAIGMGRFRSARFARQLGEGLLVLAILGSTGAFFWVNFALRREEILAFLGNLAPALNIFQRAVSMFVAPEGAIAVSRLLTGAALTLAAVGATALLDDAALVRGWGAPWSERRTAAPSRRRTPRLGWLPRQTRALVVKELPEVGQSLLAMAILLVFSLGGHVGLRALDPAAESRHLGVWKTVVWSSLPVTFFLWIVPFATALTVTPEERRSVTFLRSLPIALSRVLWIKFLIAWIPLPLCCLAMSVFLAACGYMSIGGAALTFAAALPLSWGSVMWAFLIGRWVRSPVEAEPGMIPVLLYSCALAVPMGLMVFCLARLGNRLAVPWISVLGGIILVAWMSPLPFVWRWVVRRWERGEFGEG